MTSPKPKAQGVSKAHIQGEGDYEAARRYRKDVEDFIKTADIARAARNAAPKSAAEKADMQRAEQAGLARSKAPSTRVIPASKSPAPKSRGTTKPKASRSRKSR